MAQIQSGATSDLWTIDPTSKAGRATLYDSLGNELIAKPTEGSFLASVLVRQSTTTAADAIVWSLFNASSTVKVRIRSIRLEMLFDGTAAAATSRSYYIERTTTAAPTAGTAITPAKKRSADAGSITDVRFLDTGLTKGTMGVTASPFFRIALPISVTGNVQALPLPLHLMGERIIAPILLVQNEGIGIFINDTNTTAGIGIAGVVEWDESTA